MKQTKTQFKNKFQQRMSWLPQRWRTQRNAIRVANCKTPWIIKTLNAHCASGISPAACLSECQQTLLGMWWSDPSNGWLSYCPDYDAVPFGNEWLHPSDFLWENQAHVTNKLWSWCLFFLCMTSNFANQRNVRVISITGCDNGLAIGLLAKVQSKQRCAHDHIPFWSQLKQEDPLNLSI